MKNLLSLLLSFNLIISPVLAADGDEFRESQSEGKASYANQILTMGIGVIGSNTLMTCKSAAIHPSLLAFNAGSAIYIMSELMGGRQHKALLNKSAEDLKMIQEKMKNGGEVQKAALEAALKKEEQNLAFIKQRSMWMMAVAAVYAGSAALSFVEMATPIPNPPFLLGLLPAMCDGATATMMGKVTAAGVAAAFTFGAGGEMYASMGAALASYTLAAGPIATAMNLAIPRAAIFGAAAALVATNLGSLSKKAKVTESNISDLKKVIAQFNANTTPTNGTGTDLTNATTGGTNSGAGAGVGTPRTGGTVTALPTNTTTRTCFSNTAQGFESSEAACANPTRFPAVTLDPSLNLPSLQAAGNMASDLANALASGDTAKADSIASGLATQAGRMNEIKNNLLKQTNAKLVSQGKKPIDLEAETKTQLAAMGAAYDKSSGTTDGSALASGASAAALGNDLKGVAEDKAVTNVDANSVNGKNAQNADGAPGADLGLSGSLSEGDVGSEVRNILGSGNSSADTLANNLKEQQANETDISHESDSTIFKQVSNRYLLNYDKIFKKKEIKE